MLDPMVAGAGRGGRPARVLRRAAKVVVARLDRLFQVPAHSPPRTEPPALLIVGAPRSGTTLFYQTVASHRNTVFINNLLERLPLSGVRVARWVRLDLWKPPLSTVPNWTSLNWRAGLFKKGNGVWPCAN